MGRVGRIVVGAVVIWAVGAARAEAQLGSLLSPGRLSQPHAHLEGIGNCVKCHEQGRQVTAEKCLACHKPVADRIARKTGVHRNVNGECIRCHAEHAGVDGHLRPFDQSGFDHAGVALFPLDGKHAPLKLQCAACHKTRSFLALKPDCVTCHADVHKGSLGISCATCHPAALTFKESARSYDHGKARYALNGAHAKVACEKCHPNRAYRNLKFAACTDCHQDPHRGTFAPGCARCHTEETWATRKMEHDRTRYPLVGKHAAVACALCHKQPATEVKPKSETCATCHADVHRGEFKEDCKACHNEKGFAKAPFDHAKTAFALTDKHAPVACTGCHKGLVTAGIPLAKQVVDFRGLKTTCVSCHADPHRPELGPSCEPCHSARTFTVPTFSHTKHPEFYGGQHTGVACAKCHTPASPAPTATVPGGGRIIAATYRNTRTACVSCHKDVHLGQLAQQCEQCHPLAAAKFKVAAFNHTATTFALRGKHEQVECGKCHKNETGAFPAGTGSAVRYKAMARECRACHKDVHVGQFTGSCDGCHTNASFKVAAYTHANAAWLEVFRGRHRTAKCADCHKPVKRETPQGLVTAVHYNVETACTTCHEDTHRGALGTACIDCHRP